MITLKKKISRYNRSSGQTPIDCECSNGFAGSAKLSLKLFTSNGAEINSCFRCDGNEPLVYLTPNGKRSFLYPEQRKLLLVFVLKCRPSHFNCENFNLHIEFNHSTLNATYIGDVELLTRRRKPAEGKTLEISNTKFCPKFLTE